MSQITLQKTHDLLEKLVEHVMNEVPAKHEVQQLDTKVDQLDNKVDYVVSILEKQAQQLDIIRTEQISMNGAITRIEIRLDLHEKIDH